MTDNESLAHAFERAAGICECIGGGCAALTHRPEVNRCTAPLRAADTTSFFTISRFADRTNPENVYAVCAACAETPRRQGLRVAATSIPLEAAVEEPEGGFE